MNCKMTSFQSNYYSTLDNFNAMRCDVIRRDQTGANLIKLHIFRRNQFTWFKLYNSILRILSSFAVLSPSL